MESENPKESLRDHLRKRDILGSSTFKQTQMYASFQGVQRVFKKFFGLKDLPFVHNNELKMMQRQQIEPSYPYAYMSVTSIGIPDGAMPGAALARHGAGFSIDTSNSTVQKHFYFQIQIQLEFHYVTNDTLDALLFMNKALLLINAKKFSFRLKTNGVSGIVGITTDTPELQLPRADKENEDDPEAHDLVMNFRVATWTGLSRAVAKVNNDGLITFAAMVANADGEVVDEEVSEIITADRS